MKNLTIIIFLIFISISCKHTHTNQNVVLKINTLNVSEYEIKKQVNRYFNHEDSLKKNNKILRKNKLINKYLIIADAYAKQYNSLDHIVKNVKCISDYMMTQPYSYYWNKVLLPKIDEFKEINEEKLKKRSKIYYFEVISISDKSKLLDLVKNDTIIENINEFNILKNKCVKDSAFSIRSYSAQWPFSLWYTLTDSLLNIEPGHISQLLQSNNTWYYFYLNRIEHIKVNEDNQKLLISELQSIKERLVRLEKFQQFTKAGKPRINKPGIDSIVQHLNTSADFTSYTKNTLIIEYYLNNEHKKIFYKEFIEPFSFLPILPKITNKEELLNEVNTFFINDHLADEAHKLELYEEELFLLDKINYQNNLLYFYYLENEVNNTVRIDSSEVLAYYYNHRDDKFTVPKYKYMNIYLFENEMDAMSNWEKVSNFYLNNPTDILIGKSALPGASSIIPEYKVDMELCSDFVPEETYKIHNLMVGEVSMSIAFKNKFALMVPVRYKDKYLLDISKVYSFIHNKLLEERAEIVLNKRIEELKEEYPLEIDKVEDCL